VRRRSEIVGENLGERERGELAHGVDAAHPGGDQPSHRGGDLDVCLRAAIDHARHERANAVDDAEDVDREHPVPVLDRALPQQPAPEHARVEAQQVGTSELVGDLRGEPFHFLGAAHVGTNRQPAATGFVHRDERVIESGGVDVGRNDRHALPRQLHG
jgi:hypothetical protein